MSTDYSGMGPTTVCPCGSRLFKILATFNDDTFELATYSCDMRCLSCGSYFDTPLPIHKDA